MLRSRFLLPSLMLAATFWAAPAEAKNIFPYNHPDLQWYSIETEHFVVHYPESRKVEGNDHYLSAEWTARKTAKVSEEMWPRMCAEFNYYLKEKVHIVILDQGDDLSGFTVPPWDWIEISANPGGDFYRQRSRMDWLPDVLVHEFAHVISLKAQATQSEGTYGTVIQGLYTDGIHDTATGGSLVIPDTEPVFWTEGGAEYWSDNAGYNWWTPGRDMHIRTTILDDRILQYDEWQTTIQTNDWGDGERWYQEGYSFALYLRQRFGAETYAKFGLRQAQGWQLDWTDGIEEITGVPAEQLFNDWVAYARGKYNAQYDQIRAEGEVEGREMLSSRKPWEYTDPDGRDAWYDVRQKRKWGVTGPEIARMERERQRDMTGTYSMVSRYSDDGKWYGANTRAGLMVQQTPEDAWSAFSGDGASDPGTSANSGYNSVVIPAVMMSAWDFVPGQDAVVVTGVEEMIEKPFTQYTGIRFEADGYNWNQLWYIPFPVKENKDHGMTFQGYKPKRHEPYHGAQPIPNTFRALEPSVSPDGKKIAYLEYGHGSLNVVTINLDGSDKKLLTHFEDGTWMQRLDWSPDGKQLVVAIFRNFQQDLYIMDSADGSNVHPIMYDRWEDMDPHWAKDGRIYYSSDHTGIVNVYAYDPATQRINQVTNVIGGAEAPSITPKGNLLFNQYTAFGWKNYGLAQGDFLYKDVTDQFQLQYNPEAVKTAWDFREDLSMYKPEKYKFPIMAPSGLPIIQITNDARDDVSVQLGAQAFVSDYTEDHSVFILGFAGSDFLLGGGYTYSGWYPTFSLFGYHGEFKFNYGFLLDDDQDPTTKADQSVFEGRNQQYVNFLTVDASYPWNDKFSTTIFAQGIDFGFKTSSDDRFYRYALNTEQGLRVNFNNIAWQSGRPNPTGGRNVDLTYSHGYTDIMYSQYGGRTVDDGELLDNYGYNKVEGRWTEQISMPRWGWLPGFLQIAGEKRHTIQLDLQGGWIDRNVDRNDEFRGGGQHPAQVGSDSLRPSTNFAGYPFSSLSGETMGMVNLAYRFPIRRQLNIKTGPFYFTDLTGQFGGTAGNFWSFRAPTDPANYYENAYGNRVANPGVAVKREIPLYDVAYKNGNRLLYDVSAELRVTGAVFNNAGWDSFVRVAYAFNTIGGLGDVNGDDIQDTTDNTINSELSNETEDPGLRVYVGLGTGW